jgi:23S rRNA A1618 N6-methylase RlmF
MIVEWRDWPASTNLDAGLPAPMEKGMTVTFFDEARLKVLVKEALAEVLEQRREWFSELMAEALTDDALVRAIREVEHTEIVNRDEVFDLLGTAPGV